jgi:hypothetical protein
MSQLIARTTFALLLLMGMSLSAEAQIFGGGRRVVVSGPAYTTVVTPSMTALPNPRPTVIVRPLVTTPATTTVVTQPVVQATYTPAPVQVVGSPVVRTVYSPAVVPATGVVTTVPTAVPTVYTPAPGLMQRLFPARYGMPRQVIRVW